MLIFSTSYSSSFLPGLIARQKDYGRTRYEQTQGGRGRLGSEYGNLGGEDSREVVELTSELLLLSSLQTSIMAVAYDGGVIMGADSRTTMGSYIVSKAEQIDTRTLHSY